MPSETVKIEIDDAELDAALAKLEEALGKKEQVMAEAGVEDLGEARAEIEDVKEKAEEAKATVEETKEAAQDLEPEHDKIKGTGYAARRITAQLPGIREAYRLTMLTRRLLRIAPSLALLLGAFMLGQAIWSWLEAQKREAEEYRKMVMEARGLTSRAQFETWLAEDKRRTQEAYRSVVIQ